MDELKINCQAAVGGITRFLKEEFAARKKQRAILGISGGIDSTLTAVLCGKAALDLYLVWMPYGVLSKKENMERVVKTLEKFQPGYAGLYEIDITELVNAQITKIESNLTRRSSKAEAVIPLDNIDRGNLMARQRMIIQYALARQLDGLVVGTENLSEYFLGYFTRYGDQACDINPLGGFWKTQVRELAKYLEVPPEILSQKPSADLYEGQSDEAELGFSYEEADPILYLLCQKGLSSASIIQDFSLDAGLVNRVFARVQATEYKRKEIPKYEHNQ